MYNAVKHTIWPYLHDDAVLEALGAGICGGVAGGVSAAATNPLDVVKTRLQTQLQAHEWKSASRSNEGVVVIRSAFGMLRKMLLEEGVMAVWKKGFGPRVIFMSQMSFIMLPVYETVKKFSLKPHEKEMRTREAEARLERNSHHRDA